MTYILRKRFALFSCLLMITSILFIPIPSEALKYSKNQNISSVDASFWGEHTHDYSGTSVAGAGDVNGDGYDDILIEAPGLPYNSPHTSWTYLIFGKASGWARDINISNADASFIGDYVSDYSEWSVAGVGDVNGDGYDDILIGADGNNDGGSEAGKTYLILGKASGWAMNTSLSNADASFIGEHAGDYSGNTVAGAGDVNGDGYDDILIGAPLYAEGGHSPSGKTYLIFGKASGWATDTNLSKTDASFIGEYHGDTLGISVAGARDVNGDGYNDILIGASGSCDGGLNAGKTFLIFGKASGWGMNINLSQADAAFIGEHSDEHSGYLVAGAGDVNGDGYYDILIGDGWYGEKKIYLILGKTSGWALDTNLSNADISFISEPKGNYEGTPIAGAGDVNGDGCDDILIGEEYNNDGGSHSGKTYLIFMDSNSKPASINSIKAYFDDRFLFEIGKASENDTVFIELQGVDGNSSRNDFTEVKVTSSTRDPIGFTMRLFETGKNTGTYRDNFTVKNMTNEQNRWIKAFSGETVTVTSVQDPTKNVTIAIFGPLLLFPLKGPIYINEDQALQVHFWATGPEQRTWHETDSGGWLYWDSQTHNISGTPNNGVVGNHWINIFVSMSFGSPVSRNYTIIVNNTAPEIVTVDDSTVLEDSKYGVDYNSTDDGQGNITWHLNTNARSWLSINSSTGYLSGKPLNENVGVYYVNVSVDDGNEGWGWSNFTLIVTNVNDNPYVTDWFPDHYRILEGQETVGINLSMAFNDPDMDYNPRDRGRPIDPAERLTYSVSNNRTVKVNCGDHGLSPSNQCSQPLLVADDGRYPKDIIIPMIFTAMDYYNASVSAQTNVTVAHVNHAPHLDILPSYEFRMSEDNETVIDLRDYIIDIDVYNPNYVTGDKLTYEVFGATNISVKMEEYKVTLMPKKNWNGYEMIRFYAKDLSGAGSAFDMTFFVEPMNDPPEFTSTPIRKATIGLNYYYDVDAIDIDAGDTLRYSLLKKPAGMEINEKTGEISWKPNERQVGNHEIVVQVTDMNATITQTYVLTIPPNQGISTTTLNGLMLLTLLLFVIILTTIMVAYRMREEKKKKRKKKK